MHHSTLDVKKACRHHDASFLMKKFLVQHKFHGNRVVYINTET